MPKLPSLTFPTTSVPDVDDVSVPSIEEAQAQVEQAARRTPEEIAREIERRKMEQEVYTFTYDLTTPNGKRWQGEFANVILDVKARQEVGLLAASFAGGIEVDQLTSQINQAVAHLSKSLTKRPKWAENLQTIKDYRVLLNIWEHALEHELVFFRL